MEKLILTNSAIDINESQDANNEQVDQKLENHEVNTTSVSPANREDSSSAYQSTGLEDIYQLPFSPPLPSKGPMREFVDKASDHLGLAPSHAWILWIFVTIAYCSRHLFYDDGCVERRLSLNVILAGDDESGLMRRIAVEALNQLDSIDVMTNSSVLQLEENLVQFTGDVCRVVVETGDENVFLRWYKKVSKQELSLAQLFSSALLNDYLLEKIRASAMPPVAVPVLLSCELKDVLCSQKFPYAVFRDGLVVPSFGCHRPCSFSGDQFESLLKLLSKSFLENPGAEIVVNCSETAQSALGEYLERLQQGAVSLKQEGGHSQFRRAGIKNQVMALATAYAVNSSIRQGGRIFDGKINKPEMTLALKAIDQIDQHWNELDCLYEEASRADVVDNIYEQIIARFPNYYDEKHGGLVLPFSELAKAFCHHPDREGQFNTGYLERKILSDLVLSDRARKLSSRTRRDRRWVFYTKRMTKLS